MAVLVLFLPVTSAALLEAAFSNQILLLEVLGVIALMAATCWGLWRAFVGGRLMEQAWFGRFDPLILASAIAAFAAASFGALTGLLYLEGGLEISGWNPDQPVMWQASELYLWHLAHNWPFFDITTDLRWEQPLKFEDRLGGVLVVIFTVIVILPWVQVVRLVAGYRQPYEKAVFEALGGERSGLARQGGGVLLGAGVRVDVVPELRPQDALRRLEEVRNSSMFRERAAGYAGYVLVTDVVGDPARKRIEKAFTEVPFPAVIVAWRTDEPPDYLKSVVDGVRKRL